MAKGPSAQKIREFLYVNGPSTISQVSILLASGYRITNAQVHSLKEGFYVEKVSRGIYKITEKGKKKIFEDTPNCELCYDETKTKEVLSVNYGIEQGVQTRVVCAPCYEEPDRTIVYN